MAGAPMRGLFPSAQQPGRGWGFSAASWGSAWAPGLGPSILPERSPGEGPALGPGSVLLPSPPWALGLSSGRCSPPPVPPVLMAMSWGLGCQWHQ